MGLILEGDESWGSASLPPDGSWVQLMDIRTRASSETLHISHIGLKWYIGTEIFLWVDNRLDLKYTTHGIGSIDNPSSLGETGFDVQDKMIVMARNVAADPNKFRTSPNDTTKPDPCVEIKIRGERIPENELKAEEEKAYYTPTSERNYYYPLEPLFSPVSARYKRKSGPNKKTAGQYGR